MRILKSLKVLLMINIISFDPSLRNWGYAKAELSDEGVLTILDTGIVKTKSKKEKKVRQSDKDIYDAYILYYNLAPLMEWADAVTIEVPHGSQTARGGIGNGICYGVLAALRSLNHNMVTITPFQLKDVVRKDKDHNPSKEDVIDWVKDKHPEANLPTTLSAEHICDAIVAVYAAMNTKEFKEKYEY